MIFDSFRAIAHSNANQVEGEDAELNKFQDGEANRSPKPRLGSLVRRTYVVNKNDGWTQGVVQFISDEARSL